MKGGASRSTRRRRARARVRDRARKGLAILPSLLTLGNLVCGFYAIVHVGAVQWVGGAPVPANAFRDAALAILIAMVFDMLDGRVARMTRTTSDFGGQLDSLADAVTFGVAPGVLVAMVHAMGRYTPPEPFWSKMAWVFGMAYACGAVVRLARFNTENISHDEEAHREFRGLPSPAAAGVIASLVLVHYFLLSDRADTRLAWIKPTLVERAGHTLLDGLPFVALGVGYLMVSQFAYAHVANKYLRGRKPFDFLAAAIFVGVVFALFPEVLLAVVFCGFAASGPIVALRGWWRAPAADAAQPAPKSASPPPGSGGNGAGPTRPASASGSQSVARQHPLEPLDEQPPLERPDRPGR